jgi:hypothetical protein
VFLVHCFIDPDLAISPFVDAALAGVNAFARDAVAPPTVQSLGSSGVIRVNHINHSRLLAGEIIQDWNSFTVQLIQSYLHQS